MTRRGPRRGRLGRVVRNVVPTLIVLLALEILARVGAWAWHGGNEYYLLYGIQGLVGRVGVSPWSVYDGRHYKFPPDYTLESAAGQGRESARTNSLGFRGPDFSPGRPRGTYRVVTLGGSSTFGFHNEDDETYPRYLQTVLDQAGVETGGPMSDQRRLPVLHDREHPLVARAGGHRYEPDPLTLYTAYNDASWPLHLPPFLRALFWVQQHSGFYLVLKETLLPDARVYQLRKRFRSPEAPDMSAIDADAERIAARYRRNVEAILDLARSHDVAVLLVRQPMTTATTNRRFEGLRYEEEHRLVREGLERGA